MSSPRDIRIPFNHISLVGTLHIPARRGPHPALIMLQGSGPEDRNSGEYFPPIRETFLDAGLAVLSWDKPGVGGSTGDWHQQTFFDRADEAQARLAWLRQQAEIDASRTGFWGHSQGGWIAQIVAANDPTIAFVIINSGPGVDALEQDLYGAEHTLRQKGASDTDVQQALAYMDQLHAAAREAMPYQEFVHQIMEPGRGTPGYDYFGEVDSGLWAFLVANFQRPYEPVSSLERITCPVLAVFGEQDAFVPVAKSVRIFEEGLTKAGNPDVTIAVFTGADHRIRAGDPPEFADGYLDLMANWLRDRV